MLFFFNLYEEYNYGLMSVKFRAELEKNNNKESRCISLLKLNFEKS